VLDNFWEFDRLVKDRAPRRSGDHEIFSPFARFLFFRVYVMGMGCQTMGLIHV
jgi:hypothetical protein